MNLGTLRNGALYSENFNFYILENIPPQTAILDL